MCDRAFVVQQYLVHVFLTDPSILYIMYDLATRLKNQTFAHYVCQWVLHAETSTSWPSNLVSLYNVKFGKSVFMLRNGVAIGAVQWFESFECEIISAFQIKHAHFAFASCLAWRSFALMGEMYLQSGMASYIRRFSDIAAFSLLKADMPLNGFFSSFMLRNGVARGAV